MRWTYGCDAVWRKARNVSLPSRMCITGNRERTHSSQLHARQSTAWTTNSHKVERTVQVDDIQDLAVGFPSARRGGKERGTQTHSRHSVARERDAEVDKIVLEEQLPQMRMYALPCECDYREQQHRSIDTHRCFHPL